MQSLNSLISTCEMYKQGGFDLEEFQSRIITSAIPENLSKEFLNELVSFDNQIEEIMFCQIEAEHKVYADQVADALIQAIIKEQERLGNYQPYEK